MDAIAKIAGFLLEHADLIGLIMNAVEAGMEKETLMNAVKAAMVAASDAEMKRELG